MWKKSERLNALQAAKCAQWNKDLPETGQTNCQSGAGLSHFALSDARGQRSAVKVVSASLAERIRYAATIADAR
jgi:hypothetical protein